VGHVWLSAQQTHTKFKRNFRVTQIRATSVDTPQLIIKTEQGVERFQLSPDIPWTIGRSKENTIQLGELSASRYHAKLELIQERHYYFIDLHSRNGSLVNDQPVIRPTLIKHGDQIAIGNTVIVFEQHIVSPLNVPLQQPLREVLMLQASAMQGKIWQEILLSQNASVLWEASSLDLNKRMAKILPNALPKILLIDRRAYPNSLYEFCTFCQQQYPQLSIFVMDSLRQNIPAHEREVAIQKGCINLFPAFPIYNLVDHALDITDQVNEVLRAMKSLSIEAYQLLPILQNLEDLVRQTSSFIPLADMGSDSDSEMPTSINLNKSINLNSSIYS
jgi:pSer/pThr/pTyr-binding forkhead associated (FHA) protein